MPRFVLHVGCGPANPAALPAAFFPGEAWAEIRLDIDPAVRPDVVASITDMTPVASGSVDAVWSAHNLEHLHPHEVPRALAEFFRVLRPGGIAVVTLPDLRQVAELVAADRLTEPAYVSPAGPISALDMLYGHGAAIAGGNVFMGHRGGFTARTLATALEEAGFAPVQVVPDGHFALWAMAHKAPALSPD